jgi:DNA helicase-2/ATP-dependent DNA helicase PcrA
MRNRVEKICGTEARNLYIGTFHSVFARILRYEAAKIGYPSNFTIYDTDDSRSLIKTIVKENGLNEGLYKPSIVHNRISAAKNALIGPAEYQADVNLIADDSAAGRPKIGLLYELYAKRCFMAGAMDFDDLLYKMHYLLENFPDALFKYQNRFRYIMIDEFQDTNGAQYAIVKKLGAVHENICVVGDDAQSIYSFRGATIENILNFEKDYPDLKIFKLEQNYRSTKHIVHAANKVIGNNRMQITKEIWTENHQGEKIKVIKAGSDNEEGKLIVDSVFEEKMRHQRMNSEFAILYRTHSQSRAFEESLPQIEHCLCRLWGYFILPAKRNQRLLAYLRLTMNHFDEESLKRIINYPARSIGQTSVEKALIVANEQGKRLWEVIENCNYYLPGNRSNSSISDFVTKIKSYALMAKTHNAFEIAEHIAKTSGLLHELHNDKTVEGISRYENIQELLNGIKEFTERSLEADKDPIEQEWVTIDGEVLNEKLLDKSLGAYLQEISLLTDLDKKVHDSDHVSLMTIHSAKGLEFPCVYVVGLEENLFPNAMSMSSREELEEERRLFYVAITRAQHKLALSFASTRYRFGNIQYNEPSRFLDEIDPAVLDIAYTHHHLNASSREEKFTKVTVPIFTAPQYNHKPSSDFTPDDFTLIQTGMEVEHQRFGIGKVIHLEGNSRDKMATIFFQNNVGQKKIMLRYAKLRIVKKDLMAEG